MDNKSEISAEKSKMKDFVLFKTANFHFAAKQELI